MSDTALIVGVGDIHGRFHRVRTWLDTLERSDVSLQNGELTSTPVEHATDDGDEALLRQSRQIAGLEIAIGGQRRPGTGVVVALEHLGVGVLGGRGRDRDVAVAGERNSSHGLGMPG